MPQFSEQDVPRPPARLRRLRPPTRRRSPGRTARASPSSIVVNYEEGSEYSHAAGDGRNEGLAEIPYAMAPRVPRPRAESVYEYGSRAGIWRLLRLFDEYGIQVTFFAAAVALERNPEVGAWHRARPATSRARHGWRWRSPGR